MISYISGILTDHSRDSVIIECAGIGFCIYVPQPVLEKLPVRGSAYKLHTYFHVKEDGMQLYGFPTKEELNMFEKLISVGGIGPKGALAILSSLSVDTLRFAIYAQDAKTIAKAPGIGLKTAQKMILELKDKIPAEEALGSRDGREDIRDSEAAGKRSDAVQALAALGYSSSEALRAVSAVENLEALSVEAVIKAALKRMIR